MANTREWYLDAFATIAAEPLELNPGFDPNLNYAAMTLDELKSAFDDYMDEGMEALLAEENKKRAEERARMEAIKASDNVVWLFK